MFVNYLFFRASLLYCSLLFIVICLLVLAFELLFGVCRAFVAVGCSVMCLGKIVCCVLLGVRWLACGVPAVSFDRWAVRCALSAACCLRVVVCCVLWVGYYLLLVLSCLVLAVRCLLVVVGCLVFPVLSLRSLSCVVCCALFVVLLCVVLLLVV